MKRPLLGLGLLALMLVSSLALSLVFQGPHMRVQENIRAFQAVTPPPPSGSLPREAKPSVVELARLDELHNPLEETPEILAAGKVYYRYYCVFCHGERGDGSAPVGDSYMPRPLSLRRVTLKQRTDPELLVAMLTGTGHDPVLPRVVPERHRWPLVLYVRTLFPREDETIER